jgi:transcriptional regulator with PAS, ATPase and Fis domain
MKAELESLIEQMITRGILYEEAVREFEKRFILNVLERHNHNLSKTAEALGIHRNTLSKRLEEYRQGVSIYSNGHARKQVAPRRRS